jgi:ferredoxin
MASVEVEGSGIIAPASAAESVLNALLKAGVEIRHVCGGKARCGTCVVTPLPSDGALSPVGSPEAERLKAMKAPPGARLSCQCHASGVVRVRIGAES